MYILESIQEFNGKKIGIYNLDAQTSRRVHRAENQLLSKGTPHYAIFIEFGRIRKGDHQLYNNNFSFLLKSNKEDGTNLEGTITI